MLPTQFSDALIEAYRQAGEPKYPHSKIRRGGNRSVSSEIEDLLAFYLAENLQVDEIWINQQLSINLEDGDKITVKPDLAIIKSGVIRVFVELKMDIGFARKEIGDSFAETGQRMRKMLGQTASYRNGKSPGVVSSEIEISRKADCAFVIVSSKNASDADYEAVEKSAANNKVRLYTLLRGFHPNDPKLKDKNKKCAEEMSKSLIILRDGVEKMVG